MVQKLLRQARKGTRLVYIPGNHDEFLRDYYGTHFGGIEVIEDAVHTGVDGKSYLVIHGDLFDIVIRHARWLALLGNHAYDLAIWLNTYFNTIRRGLGLTYWSLSQWAKLKVKNAVNFIGEYENALSSEAARRGVDGVICGHIHHAVINRRSDLLYINCGDWVESCTAAVEHFDGVFEIVKWEATGVRSDEPEHAEPSAPAPLAPRGRKPQRGIQAIEAVTNARWRATPPEATAPHAIFSSGRGLRTLPPATVRARPAQWPRGKVE